MPPGIRSFVTIECTLMVLGDDFKGMRVLAVDEHHQGELLPFQELFYDDRRITFSSHFPLPL